MRKNIANITNYSNMPSEHKSRYGISIRHKNTKDYNEDAGVGQTQVHEKIYLA